MILDMGVDLSYNTPVRSLRALLDEGGSTRCSSARARPRARSSSCPGREEAAANVHIGIDWLESVAFGHIEQDRRAGPHHRRRQHRDGLLPHQPAARRQETSR